MKLNNKYHLTRLLHDALDALMKDGFNVVDGDYDNLILMKKDEVRYEIGLNNVDNPTYIYLRHKQ
jgi:hypothetical protein